jgi:hypothetical protein
VVLQADVGDDAVDPGGQARLAAKVRQPAVDPQEHVLREVLGARSILYRARDQGKHQILVAIDQFLKRVLISGPAALDELALVDIFHPLPY